MLTGSSFGPTIYIQVARLNNTDYKEHPFRYFYFNSLQLYSYDAILT